MGKPAAGPLDRVLDTGIDLILNRSIPAPSTRHVIFLLALAADSAEAPHAATHRLGARAFDRTRARRTITTCALA